MMADGIVQNVKPAPGERGGTRTGLVKREDTNRRSPASAISYYVSRNKYRNHKQCNAEVNPSQFFLI